jgi:NAD(P)-dependent dehydrogenase (short-subunit alcohol dehydrogenase family)
MVVNCGSALAGSPATTGPEPRTGLEPCSNRRPQRRAVPSRRACRGYLRGVALNPQSDEGTAGTAAMRPGRKPKVWFVTGASRGLGRAVTEAALADGDRVVGVARSVEPLSGLAAASEGRLLPVAADVTDRAAVVAAVERAVAEVGRIDVVLNNAGVLLAGMVEETTEAQARAHLDVNFFGALWVVQAVLPQLREQGCGHILQVTVKSAGNGRAGFGLYGAGKAALRAMSLALAAEVADFGIRVSMIEPGPLATGIGYGMTSAAHLPAYAPTRRRLAGGGGAAPRVASAAASAARIVELVDQTEPPATVVLEA